MNPIYHIAVASDVEPAHRIGTYMPAVFAKDGFIHCSYAEQIAAVANGRFRGRKDLLLMHIDPTLLPLPIVNENLEGGAELFPHIYAPLPFSAILKIDPLTCCEDGSFDLVSLL